MFVKVDSDISVEAVREWPDPVLRDAIAALEVGFAELHALQSVVLAELVAGVGCPRRCRQHGCRCVG